VKNCNFCVRSESILGGTRRRQIPFSRRDVIAEGLVLVLYRQGFRDFSCRTWSKITVISHEQYFS
jgi:hypothetical protein